MPKKRLNAAHGFRSRRKLLLAIGDLLFDGKGHAYQVVSVDEPDTGDPAYPATELCVRPVEEEPTDDAIGLTPRQLQIARLLANRTTNAEIAASLGISVHTARHHSQKVLEKLGITSRADVRTRFDKPTRGHESMSRARRDR
jgi:DNA-binding CsgD family transcriptional regulator